MDPAPGTRHQCPRRGGIAQQVVHGKLRQQRSLKLSLWRDHGGQQLQHRHGLALGCGRLHKQAQAPLAHLCQCRGRRPIGGQGVATVAAQRCGQRGRTLVGQHHALRIDPADGLHLWRVVDQHLRPTGKGLQGRGAFLGAGHGQIARQTQHLLLAFQQAQTHLLLGVIDGAHQRILLARLLLRAQVPKRSGNREQEQRHRHQRCPGGQPILA